MPKIAIVGLGLIGTSLGLALHRAGAEFEVVGHDRDPEMAAKARKLGAVDRTEWSLPNAVDGAQLVVIATPLGAIEDVLKTAAPHLSPGSTVTDTASTKSRVIALASSLLPDHVSFVGGHPMAGKERTGAEAAEADLFEGKTYCVMPAPNASDEAVDLVVGMVNAIGAKPFFVDPLEHDGYVAAVSHLPFLAATALVRAAVASPAWRDAARVAASGFRDTTRLASGSVEMHRDICLTNREEILRWLDLYSEQINSIRDLVAKGDAEALQTLFEEAKQSRDRWLRDRESTTAQTPSDSFSAGDELRQMFLGRWGQKRRDPRQ